MTAFNDIPIRVNGPVRVRRVNNGAGVAGRANARDGIEIRPSNKGKTVEGRRVMAHEMAHMMDYRDLDERQRQHIGQAILGGKWDAEKLDVLRKWLVNIPLYRRAQ